MAAVHDEQHRDITGGWIRAGIFGVSDGLVTNISLILGFAGANRVRFPSPVPVGSHVRAGATMASLDPVSGGVQVTLDVTVEVRDAAKPGCVAQVVYRYYR